MRKKEYLSELKARIDQLEQEKEQLVKENLAHQMNSNVTPTVDPAVVTGLNGAFPYSSPLCIFLYSCRSGPRVGRIRHCP